MSTTAIVVAVPASVAFPLLLWAIGRAVTAVASRTPADAGRSRQYLAGRLYGVQVIAIVACDDELLVAEPTRAGHPGRPSPGDTGVEQSGPAETWSRHPVDLPA